MVIHPDQIEEEVERRIVKEMDNILARFFEMLSSRQSFVKCPKHSTARKRLDNAQKERLKFTECFNKFVQDNPDPNAWHYGRFVWTEIQLLEIKEQKFVSKVLKRQKEYEETMCTCVLPREDLDERMKIRSLISTNDDSRELSPLGRAILANNLER